MARKNMEILSDLIQIYIYVSNKTIVGDMNSLRKKYLPIRTEFQNKYPNNSVIEKVIYTSNGFNFKLSQIQDECEKMLEFLMSHSTE